MIDVRSSFFARFFFFFLFIFVCVVCIICNVIFHVFAIVFSKKAIAARFALASKNRLIIFLLLN